MGWIGSVGFDGLMMLMAVEGGAVAVKWGPRLALSSFGGSEGGGIWRG